MTFQVVKVQSNQQELFSSFLNGSTLPYSVCDKITTDVDPINTLKITYDRMVNVVKTKLKLNHVHLYEDVLFVNYTFIRGNRNFELVTLIRILNMRYKNNRFIVLNGEEVIYFPPGSKITHSGNELSDWLQKVTEKHLAHVRMSERKLRVKSYVDRCVGAVKHYCDTLKACVTH